MQLNENNDIVDDNNLEENVPTYVVIKDNIPTILKPWSRTPTPSLLIRKSRPSSSLEEWHYNNNNIDGIGDRDMIFQNMYHANIKQRQMNEHHDGVEESSNIIRYHSSNNYELREYNAGNDFQSYILIFHL